MPNRLRPHPVHHRRALVGLGLCALASMGCSLDSNFGDLGEKLLDPELRGLDVPGRRLVRGTHYRLSMRQDSDGTPLAMARSEEGELVIVNFTTETHCRAPGVDRYAREVERGDESYVIVLEYDDRESAYWLGFVTHECQRSAFRLLVRGFPIRLGGELAGQLLAHAPDGRLLRVDPWEETSETLASNVDVSPDRNVFPGHFVWYEAGELVIRDRQLQNEQRLQGQISWLGHSEGAREVAYLDGGSGGTLFVAPEDDLSLRRELARDVCNPRFVSVGSTTYLRYLSPCASRTAVLHNRQSDEVWSLADQVVEGPVVRTLRDSPYVTYVTQSDDADATGGTLWLAREPSTPPVRVADNATASPGALESDGTLLALLDVEATGGRLAAFKNDELSILAEQVSVINPIGRMRNGDLTLLTRFEGGSGTLARLSASGELSTLYDSVLLESISGDAFVANFDGTTGDLILLDRATGETDPLASGVLPSTFAFAQQYGGIYMLSDRDLDTNTSTLRVQLLEAGQSVVINSGVTEALEVPFPSPGFLYNVVTGDEPGIWFAKAL